MTTPQHASRGSMPDQDRAAKAPSTTDDLDRLAPDRKHKVILLLRFLALFLALQALIFFGLRDLSRVWSQPVAARATAVPTPPATVATPGVDRTGEPPNAESTAAATEPGRGETSLDLLHVESDDGLATLQFPATAQAANDAGNPVDPQAITLSAVEVGKRLEVAMVGLGYVIGPPGVVFSPPAVLTITYDPSANYPFKYFLADCEFMDLSYLDVPADRLVAPWPDSTRDREAHTMQAEVDHGGTVVIFCHVTAPPISMIGGIDRVDRMNCDGLPSTAGPEMGVGS